MPGTSNDALLSTHLQSIVKTSPRIAAQLPDVMRNLANELEAIAGRDTFLENALPEQSPQEANEHKSLTCIVASHISAAFGPDVCGRVFAPSDTPQVNALQRNDPPHNLYIAPAVAKEQYTRQGLHLRLLGTPEVSMGGARLAAVERCSRAALVLYLLALHRGGLSGHRLMTKMKWEWDDLDAIDEDAALSLSAHRTFIWRLRKLSGLQDIVVAHCPRGGRQNRYMLPASTTCDLWDFEDKLDEAGRLMLRANVEPEAAERAASLRQEAILLYGGEFCQGVATGAIVRAADFVQHRYLQAVLSQAAYWKNKALRLRKSNGHADLGGRVPEEENAWLEALKNYSLAAHVEPYEESARAGSDLCQARLTGHMGP